LDDEARLRAVVGDSLGDGCGERRAGADRDAGDRRGHAPGERLQARARAGVGRAPHARDERDRLVDRKPLAVVVVRELRQAVLDEVDAPPVDQRSVARDGDQDRQPQWSAAPTNAVPLPMPHFG
jgi:hypothetical protein